MIKLREREGGKDERGAKIFGSGDSMEGFEGGLEKKQPNLHLIGIPKGTFDGTQM